METWADDPSLIAAVAQAIRERFIQNIAERIIQHQRGEKLSLEPTVFVLMAATATKAVERYYASSGVPWRETGDIERARMT